MEEYLSIYAIYAMCIDWDVATERVPSCLNLALPFVE